MSRAFSGRRLMSRPFGWLRHLTIPGPMPRSSRTRSDRTRSATEDGDPRNELFGDRVDFRTMERDVLEITAFEHPRDYGEHFKAMYGPTIVAQANARKTEREAEFDEGLNQFCDEWNRGTPDSARFEQEYLLAVGTRG
jgi:hypothetical protein